MQTFILLIPFLIVAAALAFPIAAFRSRKNQKNAILFMVVFVAVAAAAGWFFSPFSTEVNTLPDLMWVNVSDENDRLNQDNFSEAELTELLEIFSDVRVRRGPSFGVSGQSYAQSEFYSVEINVVDHTSESELESYRRYQFILTRDPEQNYGASYVLYSPPNFEGSLRYELMNPEEISLQLKDFLARHNS